MPANMDNSPVATGVEKIGSQQLDHTEDIDVVLLTQEQVLDMMMRDELKQALMLAPLWRYFATNHLL